MFGTIGTTRVRKTVDGMTQSIRETVIKGGRVLLLKGEKGQHHSAPVPDRFGEESQGVTVETEYGFRTNLYSFDPAIKAAIRSLKHDDRINATGIKKRSGAIRLTSLEVVQLEAEAPSAPAPAA